MSLRVRLIQIRDFFFSVRVHVIQTKGADHLRLHVIQIRGWKSGSRDTCVYMWSRWDDDFGFPDRFRVHVIQTDMGMLCVYMWSKSACADDPPTFPICSHILGIIIIPTDFHIFQRGRYTTNLIESWNEPFCFDLLVRVYSKARQKRCSSWNCRVGVL